MDNVATIKDLVRRDFEYRFFGKKALPEEQPEGKDDRTSHRKPEHDAGDPIWFTTRILSIRGSMCGDYQESNKITPEVSIL